MAATEQAVTLNVTRSHGMSLYLKFGNLIYLHVSNLQALLVILILKSRFYSPKCGCDVFWKVLCVAEAILRKSALKFSLYTEYFFLFGTQTYIKHLGTWRGLKFKHYLTFHIFFIYFLFHALSLK